MKGAGLAACGRGQVEGGRKVATGEFKRFFPHSTSRFPQQKREALLADGVGEVGDLPSFAAGPKGHRFGGQARIFQFATNQRCGHPGQQHGLLIPLRILSIPTLMRRDLVSAFLGEITQQIHSFRASGVMDSQRLFAKRSAWIAF